MAGPTALTDQQRRALAADGYLLVPSLLAADAIASLATYLEQLVRTTADSWDAKPGMKREEGGVVRLEFDLADPRFADLVRHPALFSAAGAVIGPGCRVNGLSLRAPLPGAGLQGLHPDYYPGHRTSGPWQVLAAMWCISAFTRDNGPLRVLPGPIAAPRTMT